MTISRSCRVFLPVLVLAAATTHAQDSELSRGAELLAPFKKELQQALKGGLAEGPDAAIQVCRVKAPGIAHGLSVDGLTCDGSELAPGVAAQLAELYSDDKATGFEAGDLRGVFWLEFPGDAQ